MQKLPLFWTSIIEAMVVLLVVVSWITWVYWLLHSSNSLANSTALRIEAIQIARDGLESFTNIRDTNWLKYAADYDNCWNVRNYNNSCIGDTSTSFDITNWTNQGFTIYKNTNNQFELFRYWGAWASWDYANTTYRGRFQVFKDSDSFYTQTGTLWVDKFDFDPIYTREMRVSYIDTNGWAANSNDEKVEVTAIVRWKDTSSDVPRELQMSTLLSNWKAKQ